MNLNMNKSFPIRRLPVNRQGKDYVVGDLHGCWHLLERTLDLIGFRFNHDRLFSVGDIIDRGPESLHCLQLLEQPWFFAVLGNHEYMLLEFLQDYLRHGKLETLHDVYDTGFLEFGGDWIIQHYDPQRQVMSDDFNQGLKNILELPIMLVVGEGKQRFHVVHAELAKHNQPDMMPDIWLDADIDLWLQAGEVPPEAQERLLWSRTLDRTACSGLFSCPDRLAGLSTTFCGHTYSKIPRQVFSHICVDTGAFTYLYAEKVNGLTVFDVQANRWLKLCNGIDNMLEVGEFDCLFC
jgi:serine/threonine protein phosphatase 1